MLTKQEEPPLKRPDNMLLELNDKSYQRILDLLEVKSDIKDRDIIIKYFTDLITEGK